MTVVAAGEATSSVGQRLLWALDRVRGSSGALNCPLVCWIDGPFSADRAASAMRCLAAVHPSLRTTVVPGRTVRQRVHPAGAVPVAALDVSAKPDPEAAALAGLAGDLRLRVDPARWPIRVTLWRLAPDRHLLAVNAHHVATDLWSTGVLLEDLAGVCAGEIPVMPEWSYADVVAREQEVVAAGRARPDEAYWRARLAGFQATPLPLVGSAPRTAPPSVHQSVMIPPVVAATIEALAHRAGVTTFSAMLATFYALLHRRSGSLDLSTASLFADRSRSEVVRTVGFLVNLLVLRVRLPPDPSYAEILRQASQAVAGALAHVEVPYHTVHPAPELERGRRGDDVVFHMTAAPIDRAIAAGPVTLRAVIPETVGRFDAEVAVTATGGGLLVRLTHNPDRLDMATGRILLDEYAALAASVVADPDAPVASLALARRRPVLEG